MNRCKRPREGHQTFTAKYVPIVEESPARMTRSRRGTIKRVSYTNLCKGGKYSKWFEDEDKVFLAVVVELYGDSRRPEDRWDWSKITKKFNKRRKPAPGRTKASMTKRWNKSVRESFVSSRTAESL